MKTLIIILLSMFTAAAQDMSDPIRVVSTRRVSLQPLFNWWTNALVIAQTNSHLSNSKQIPFPDRPLKHWLRITSVGAITNNGFEWFAVVRIQSAPDFERRPSTNKLVVLRHGPFEEKKKLDTTVAALNQTIQSKANAQRASAAHTARADDLEIKASAATYVGNVFGDARYHNSGRAYFNQARAADNRAAIEQRRVQNLDQQREQLLKITQGRSTLTVDNFAMATGQSYRGVPVYEVGLQFGR